MKNNGLFCSLFIEDLKDNIKLDDAALGRMATLAHAWRNYSDAAENELWKSFFKPALSYLEFVPANQPLAPGVYPLYEDYSFAKSISMFYLVPPGQHIDDTSVGRFHPAKLLLHLNQHDLSWGILSDGSRWRLYSTKSSRPYEDYVELSLAKTLDEMDEHEYGLFEHFFHRDSFVTGDEGNGESRDDKEAEPAKCRLDHDRDRSEKTLEQYVKEPFLQQVDEVLQNICNGFIYETSKSKAGGQNGGLEYTDEGRKEIFESAVKLIYRCLFLFYAESRQLFPTEPDQAELYQSFSMETLCRKAHKFRWGERRDYEQYDLWKHLQGLVDAVNNGDPEYGVMGYDGGLFDNKEEVFLGKYQLRNNFLSRALYLLAFVDPPDNEPNTEYPIPYEDLEVRHLGELYENILEYTVHLADTDYIRRRNKRGTELLLASGTTERSGDMLIRKGQVYFGETALERKQTGSYYTPESLVRFLNQKSIIQPLEEIFKSKYRQRFDELLEQIHRGHNDNIKRGAALSAAELIERFVEDKVLTFTVCDPAMGSGHFLVNATNQMAGMIASLLAEVPYVEGAVAGIGHPNFWRRRITRYCVYGVDLNPLAVNLAKLSLWLNCFAAEHKLTFLDHHLRCGNSLIGIRSFDQLKTVPRRKRDSGITKDKQLVLFDIDNLSVVLAKAADRVAKIVQINEDDTDTQKNELDRSMANLSVVKPLADLYTAFLMDPDVAFGNYAKIFEHLAADNSDIGTTIPDLPETLEAIEQYSLRHSYFHWSLEFPEVFGPVGASGFSATVGNPPWDIVKPNSQEFFSNYDSNFRRHSKQEANRISKELMAQNPEVAEKWDQYRNSFSEQSVYFKEPASYNYQGRGDINTFKLFLEQFFAILKHDGRMGIVVPSGIYTDLGCLPLRELFFEKSRIEFLYCFENRWPTVFNSVDGRFKFVLFGTQKGGETGMFKCAFMEHDPERLPAIDANALKMSVKQVKKFSPDTLSIMEFKNQRDVDITENIFEKIPLMGDKAVDTWAIILKREIQDYADKFIHADFSKGRALVEGKWIHQFDYQFSSPTYFYDESAYSALANSDEYISDRRFKNKSGVRLDTSEYRLVCRRQAASTNERSLISTVIQPGDLCGDNLEVSKVYDDNGSRLLKDEEVLLTVSFFNSFVVDYVIRNKITTNLNKFYLYQLPIIRSRSKYSDYNFLIARISRLICQTYDFADLWNCIYSHAWQHPNLWYPSHSPIDTYGPAHEQQIRLRLKEEAKNLTPEWGSHCGVHDRLPDRRDTGDRAQLRAEIDAYVAHLYGLSRDDFAYILDTFPVLKRKEEQAFGEFKSKRKCLEEYDRIKLILEGQE